MLSLSILFWCSHYIVRFGEYLCAYKINIHSSVLKLLPFFLKKYCRTEIEDPSDIYVPVHEFRIPYKALLGLHAYFPVHFDAFHPVLVDLTMHIVYLKAGVTKSSQKVHRFVIL